MKSFLTWVEKSSNLLNQIRINTAFLKKSQNTYIFQFQKIFFFRLENPRKSGVADNACNRFISLRQ